MMEAAAESTVNPGNLSKSHSLPPTSWDVLPPGVLTPGGCSPNSGL